MAFAALTASAITGCSSPDNLLPDASAADAPAADVIDADAPGTDALIVDASVIDAPAVDAPRVDAPAVDAPVVDAPVVDAPVADVSVADVPRVDAPAVDVPAVDVPRVDVPVVDAQRPDVAPVDAAPPADTGCAGTFTVRVTAPTAMQEIETCTVSGAPVYFTFAAEPSGPAASVEFAWRTPEGTLAPPPWPADTAAPFTARRQVGGMMIDVPPLAVLSRRTNWTLEVTARDNCGRTATTTQPFSLIFTNHGCPNP